MADTETSNSTDISTPGFIFHFESHEVSEHGLHVEGLDIADIIEGFYLTDEAKQQNQDLVTMLEAIGETPQAEQSSTTQYTVTKHYAIDTDNEFSGQFLATDASHQYDFALQQMASTFHFNFQPLDMLESDTTDV